MPARFDYRTCEPFRAWNRIEPRTRKEDFQQALNCEIHDPLWMLTRQWQFGEFKGEDTGSAIIAKTVLKTSALTRYRSHQQTARPYSDQTPLEMDVESEPQTFDYRRALQAGRHWMRLLATAAKDFNNAPPNGVPTIDLDAYQAALVQRFPFELPAVPTPTESSHDHAADVRDARLLTNHQLRQFTAAAANRAVNGKKLFEEISLNAALARTWALDPGHADTLEAIANLFKGWVDRKFARASSHDRAWDDSRLEYRFTCAAPDHNGGTTLLRADEYYSGTLDWYAFDVGKPRPDEQGLTTMPANTRSAALNRKVQTFIPTSATFAGMPNARWWEFEDGAVDLGNISADTTDLAKVVLSEFAMVYGNDWFVLPYPVNVGSICEVGGIVVTDVFGQHTLVEAASQGTSDDWESWGLFNLSPQRENGQVAVPVDTRLFIPPTLARTQESENVEEALFVRDEMANLVWAIETKIPDLLGRSQDGHTSANDLRELWLELQAIDPDADPVMIEEAIFKYQLGNTVPENWIPFMAIHKPDGQIRAFSLQRASIPREYFRDFAAVRPRTKLLRFGLEEDDTQATPYFVNEEEIPRAGIRLSANYQRARWYNGTTFQWYGRRKTVGRGEGASGLAYDTITRGKK
ncbi:MAG: hypothetical protein AAF840_06690 [Bacteroidota bacterium]